MAVSPHPSVKPSKPHKPPVVHHEAEHEHGAGQEGVKYGSNHTIKTHGMGNHKSEFPGAEGGFSKAGDQKY